jgi:putative mRNA 3-end processing factor
VSEIVQDSAAGLFCPGGAFHIDPLLPVERAVLTHAHADHARPGSGAYLCTREALPLLRRRLGPDAHLEALAYGERRTTGDVVVSLHPAGHVLGSAQVRIESRDGVCVVTGDYKREPDPTCAPFEPQRCDVLVTEATWALPIFRWDDPGLVARDILAWWEGNRDKPSLLFCYVLGKAQRILGELAKLTDRPVFVHGAIEPYVAAYREAGVQLLPTRLVSETERGRQFRGELILAPITARGSPWMKRFGAHESAFASGEMRMRGTRRRRSFDRGFALSDHADWPGILRTVRESGAARVLATHGHRDALVRYLRETGADAAPIGVQAPPDPEGD